MSPELLALLKCPHCGGVPGSNGEISAHSVTCQTCGRVYRIVGNITRFVDVPTDQTAKRTQDSFGYEWTHFNDWTQSGETNFKDYFQGIDLADLRDFVVLDAGCGMGRHARQIAAHARHVVAVDFSEAIDQA